MKLFDVTNELVKSFRRIQTQLRDPAANNLRLRIVGARDNSSRQYDLPTGSELAGLIPESFRDLCGTRSELKPQIVARVFKMKLNALEDEISRSNFFGKTVAETFKLHVNVLDFYLMMMNGYL
ncbi:unnamed protein product [Linum trigynum]|uniref:Uncharacterized protein n=1 Tax=Linum trigynum TaxID=586398 RepID=A0AAV2FSE5_9ROSI